MIVFQIIRWKSSFFDKISNYGSFKTVRDITLHEEKSLPK